MTHWVKTSKTGSAKMVVGAHPETGVLLLHDGTTAPANTVISDRVTEEWYEDLKNGVGRFLAFLETHPVRMWKGESGTVRRFYCEICGTVRKGENPVILLLESVAALTAQYESWYHDDTLIVDAMNLIDELVVYGHHTDFELHQAGMRVDQDRQVCAWTRKGKTAIKKHQNALIALIGVIFPNRLEFHACAISFN